MFKVFLFCLLSSFIAVNAAANELSGAYVGCGKSAVFGDIQVVFHLAKLPTGLEESEFQYSAAFSWLGSSAIYFPHVLISTDGARIFMRTEIEPRREFGLIINTLSIDVLPDGSLSGVYQTNSMGGSGALLGGTWKAHKVAGESIPRLTCK